ITIVGTALSMFLIVLTGYPLSHGSVRGTGLFMKLLLFTMMFNGGLIPNFYLIRSLGLYNTLWALILPGSLSAYNVVLMKNYLQSLPASMEESARIDGASEITILLRIILPLSAPILATLSLFCAVGRWNSFFNAIVYIKDTDKWTLQLLLREIVMTVRASVLDDPEALNGVALQNVKYAAIVIAVFPIMCVYPFLQRYFIVGMTLGAIKQ
ncbi:MAG TPA: carbohydrate ABC transporter permease, partial [Clostridia bacterium]|nr:carbohydrate ABC transporter permease [Clostridia bacterium]